MLRPLALAFLCCCANTATQKLAEQSTKRALTQLAPPWGDSGPPKQGAYTKLEDLEAQILAASNSLLALWQIKPHDSSPQPDAQKIVVSMKRYQVQLDYAESEEQIFLLQTYSGELFVLLFAQTEEKTWAPVDAYRLPALARRESCRGAGDGVVLLQNIQTTSNAPPFLWVEVQVSNQCGPLPTQEKTLHLLALQGGYLRPALELVLTQSQQNQDKQKAGEQLDYQIKADSKKGTLLLSGVHRMFPTLGGDIGQEALVKLWYYFDGTRYRLQK
jgi:hypothetical protein